MPRPILDAEYVHRFNACLAELNSSARVALTRLDAHAGMLELRDEEENFLDLIPGGASPDMAEIAIGLYARGFSLGVRGGEEAAFAKLRHLIGAANAPTPFPYL